ncbi:hypothetical protein PInf_010853 [Phytophthora infestans]|nr:hypothetical protein PInf_010853 [Phytophthora infestans]
MFAPVAMAQAKWPMLGPELTQPVRAANINQLVEETVLLLKAMGYRCNSRPSSLILADWSLTRGGAELWQWKKKLRVAFGLEKVPGGTKKRNVGRYRELYDAADEAEAYEEDEEDDDAFDVRGNRKETVRDYIRNLSFDAAEEDSTQYLEVRTHASLDKIAEFEGKRYRSDASLQWLKRFIYEMKSTRMPQSAWCETFSLCLERVAKSWYRQLSKKTQRRWKLLSEAFLAYYCSQFDQSARTRYYSARRKLNEPICDFLIRLNGYARTTKIQYGKGGADAAELEDISKVDQIRLVIARGRDDKRKDQSRRDERRDGRRDEKRSRKEENRDRRVTVVDADSDGEELLDQNPPSPYNSEDEWGDEDQSGGYDAAEDDDYIDAGVTNDEGNTPDRQENSARDQNGSNRSWGNSASRPPRPYSQREQSNRGDESRDNSQPGIRLDLYNSAVKLPDEMVIPLIRSSYAPTKTELGPNVPCGPPDGLTIESRMTAEFKLPRRQPTFKLEDVRADRTPVLHDGQDGSYHLTKFEDDGAFSDASTNSAAEGTSAVRAKEEVSATEDSAITEGDPEERSEQVLRDAQPVIDDRAKCGVIRPSLVGEVSSAMSTLTTISAGINQVVTATRRSKIKPQEMTWERIRRDIGRPTTRGMSVDAWIDSDEGEARAESGVEALSSAAVVNSASVDLNTESDSNVATTCRQDVSYPGDAFARKEVSSAVAANSADQHFDATKNYDSREVLLHERIKPNDDPATADSALETMWAETGSDVVRRHADDTIDLENKFEHAGVRSAIAVNSADTGPDVDDNYDLSEVSLLGGTVTEVGVTNSAATVFDPGGIDYGLGQAEDDECSSTRDPTETLRQHYLAIAATEDEQEDDVDDGTTNVFERGGTDLELTDYAHELAFLPDLTEVEPTELDYSAANVKSSSHTPAQSAKLVTELQKHEGVMISSGNALPPPAYGALCDIDVQGHAPIKQRARRIPLRHLSKLYELLKGLLRVGLISFSGSPWASPVRILGSLDDTPNSADLSVRLCTWKL